MQENWRSAELLLPNDGTKLGPLPEHRPVQLITLERLLLLLLLRAPLRKAQLAAELGVKALLDIHQDEELSNSRDGREERLGRLGQPKITMLGPFEGSQEPLNLPLAMQAPTFLLELGLDEHL